MNPRTLVDLLMGERGNGLGGGSTYVRTYCIVCRVECEIGDDLVADRRPCQTPPNVSRVESSRCVVHHMRAVVVDKGLDDMATKPCMT